MGRVAAAYGVQGWIRVQPYTSERDALLGFSTWWLAKPGSAPQARRVLEGRTHGAYVLARLEGIASREEAAGYRGLEVSVPRELLPQAQDGEVYLEDLVGLQVVNRRQAPLGVVAEVRDNGAQPLLRVVDDSGERLIPFVPAYVVEVDLEAQRIEVDWEADY